MAIIMTPHTKLYGNEFLYVSLVSIYVIGLITHDSMWTEQYTNSVIYQYVAATMCANAIAKDRDNRVAVARARAYVHGT